MEISLKVDRSTCIKCGKCVKVCPSRIFFQEYPAAEVETRNVETCIVCGHCVAVCPTFSVLHSAFPQSKVHKIDYGQIPTPEQMTAIIRARRSNRAFSSRPVPDEYFDAILEAAHRAPTATNAQKVSFTLITDPDMLKKVTARTMEMFESNYRKLKNPILGPLVRTFKPEIYKMLPYFEKITTSYKSGIDPILRNATAVILFHTPDEVRFGCQDCNLAYQNASLMASSLEVAHFYTGFVCAAAGQDKKNSLARDLGINGRIHAGMALAMPSVKYPNYIDKEEIKVNYFL